MTTVMVAASVGVWGAGLAAADPVGVTLHYTCSLAPYPDQPMTAQVTWDAPTSVMVGQTTPAITVTATATIGPLVTGALGQVGAATVEGSAEGPGMVVAPEGNISSALQLTVPRTDVPASGPITVQATGTTPRFVFHQPGHATTTIGNDFTAHVILRDANGNPTGPGEVDPSCTLDPGQNTVVYSFDITSPVVPTPPRTTKTAGTGARETSTPGPSGSTSATTGSAAPSTAVSVTAAPTATATVTPTTTRAMGDGPASTRAKGYSPASAPAPSWTGGPTGMGWWLVVAAVVPAGAGVIGGVWWLKRRRGRHVPRH